MFERKNINDGGQGLENTKYVAPISTIMRALTTKEGDLLSHFNKIDESQAEINSKSPKHLLVDSHDIAANKRIMKGQLPREHFFWILSNVQKNY